MNCKQIDKLLPLYIGRDLDAQSERLVTMHVESCAACSAAAGEYRQTRELLQEFTPPPFGEDVYAGIRQNVWRQIEADSATVSMSELIAGWFRPRVIWAAASAAVGCCAGVRHFLDWQPADTSAKSCRQCSGN